MSVADTSARIQRYDPYRSGLLNDAELAALHKPNPRRVVLDTLWRWSLIVGGWWLAARSGHPAAIAAAMVWTGTQFYALFIIGHDGMHRRLFERPWLNDLWNDVFVLAPMGAVTRLNRLNHMRHHAFLALPHDPDRYKYERRPGRSGMQFWIELSGLSLLPRVAANVFRSRSAPARDLHRSEPAARSEHSERSGRSLRDWSILIAVNAILVAGLTWRFGPWGYPLLWLLPVYLFVYAADLARTYLEHALLPGEEANQVRLSTFEAPWLERQFFAPMNMNFHCAHHLYPAIPYHRLPEADALLKAREGRFPELARRRSYLGHLRALFAANRRRRSELVSAARVPCEHDA